MLKISKDEMRNDKKTTKIKKN